MYRVSDSLASAQNGDVQGCSEWFWWLVDISLGLSVVFNNLYDVGSAVYYYLQDSEEVSYMLVLSVSALVLQIWAAILEWSNVWEKIDDSEVITGAWEALFLVPGFFALGPAIVAANFGNDLYPFIRAFFQVHDSTTGSATDSACPPDLASYDLVLLTISGLFMALTLAADAYDLWAWPSDLTVAQINLSRTWPEHFPMALICLAKLVVLLPIGAVYVFRSYLPVLSPFVAAVLCELISRVAQRITGQTCEWDHSRRFLGNHTDFPIVLAEHFSVFFGRVPPAMLPVVSLAVFGITLGVDGGVGLLDHDDRVLCTPFEYRVGCWMFVAYIVYLHVLQFVNSVQNLYGVRFLVRGGNPSDLIAHRRRLPCAHVLGLCLMQDSGKRRSVSNTRQSSKRVQDITATAEPPRS